MFCPLYLGSRGFHPAASFRTQLCAYTRCKTPPLEASTIKDLRIAEMEKQRVQSWSCRGLEKQTFNNRTGSRRKSLRALKGTCPRPPPVLWECQAREHVIQWWQNVPVQCGSRGQRAGIKQGGSIAFFNASNTGEPGNLRSRQHSTCPGT